jgi:hypothetical protein
VSSSQYLSRASNSPLLLHGYFSNRIICDDNFFHAPPSAVPAIPKDDIFVDIYTFGDIYNRFQKQTTPAVDSPTKRGAIPNLG